MSRTGPFRAFVSDCCIHLSLKLEIKKVLNRRGNREGVHLLEDDLQSFGRTINNVLPKHGDELNQKVV